MTIEDLIKTINENQYEELYPFAETLLMILENAQVAAEKSRVWAARVDALQAIQIGLAATFEARGAMESDHEED